MRHVARGEGKGGGDRTTHSKRTGRRMEDMEEEAHRGGEMTTNTNALFEIRSRPVAHGAVAIVAREWRHVACSSNGIPCHDVAQERQGGWRPAATRSWSIPTRLSRLRYLGSLRSAVLLRAPGRVQAHREWESRLRQQRQPIQSARLRECERECRKYNGMSSALMGDGGHRQGIVVRCPVAFG
eukprot:6997650-Pyramimonas_sp.AAC.1